MMHGTPYHFKLMPLLLLILIGIASVPLGFAQEGKKPVSSSAKNRNEVQKTQANEARKVLYLRERVTSLYSEACGIGSGTDQQALRQRKVARIALAADAESLANIR